MCVCESAANESVTVGVLNKVAHYTVPKSFSLFIMTP